MRNKKIFWLSAVFVILVIMSFVDFVVHINRNAHEETYSELKFFSVQACNSVNVTIENSILSLTEISNSFSDMRSAEDEEVFAVLKQISESSEFSNMCVIDQSGMGVFDSGKKVDLSDRDYYINGMQGKSGISDVVTSKISGKKYLILYAPVYGTGRDISGVIQGAYDMESLSKIISVDSFDEKGNMYLFNVKGELILGSEKVGDLDFGDNVFQYFEQNVEFTSEEREQFYQNIKLYQSGFAKYKKEGIEYVGYYQPLIAPNWYIINVMSQQLINSRMLDISRFAFSFLIRCLIFFCLLFLWTLRTERKMRQTEMKIADEAHISQLVQEQQKSNQLILESVKLAKQANRTKSEFLSRMSHEIKTPINAIIGMNEKARNHMNQPQIQQQCFQKIEKSSQELLAMYQKILDTSDKDTVYSRALSEEKINLSELIMLIQTHLSEDISQKSIRIVWQVQFPEDYTVIIDSECLHLILINMLRNAIRYSPENSEIIFKAAIIEDARSFAVCGFEVQDKMTQITEQELKKLMSVYENGEEYYKEGTGIELRVAYNLTALLNGLMTCGIDEGIGTIVHIDIPVRKSIDSVQEPKTNKNGNVENQKKYHLSGRRILLVEDNEINMEIAKMYLEDADIIITPAADGKIALLEYIESPIGFFDLILTDIRMPNMDGRELASAIRESERSDAKGIPIIAMSADAFSEDMKLSQSVGMNDYLMKPIQKEDLYDILEKYLVLSQENR